PVAIVRGVEPGLQRVTLEQRQAEVIIEGHTRGSQGRRLRVLKWRDEENDAGGIGARLEHALALPTLAGELQVPLRKVGGDEPLEALNTGISQHHVARDVGGVDGRGSLGGELSPVATAERKRGRAFLLGQTVAI